MMAAVGAALGAMVGWLSYGRRKFESVDGIMRDNIPPVYDAMQRLVPMVDRDTQAFADYMDALGMPQESDEERHARHEAMQRGLKRAVEVPLTTMRIADECWDAMVTLAAHVNIAMKSDLEVGARALETGIWGCQRNVIINLGDIEDQDFAARTQREAEQLSDRAVAKSREVLEVLQARKA